MEADKPILLVDDSENDLFFMRYALRQAGVRNLLITLRDGREAIEYLSGMGDYADRSKHPLPCLIITDLKMPRIDGFELLKWLQQQPELSPVPRIVMSSSGEEKDRRRAAESGSCAYFVKPGAIRELVKVIETLDSSWIAAHCPRHS